jgi:hypothetical protein
MGSHSTAARIRLHCMHSTAREAAPFPQAASAQPTRTSARNTRDKHVLSSAAEMQIMCLIATADTSANTIAVRRGPWTVEEAMGLSGGRGGGLGWVAEGTLFHHDCKHTGTDINRKSTGVFNRAYIIDDGPMDVLDVLVPQSSRGSSNEECNPSIAAVPRWDRPVRRAVKAVMVPPRRRGGLRILHSLGIWDVWTTGKTLMDTICCHIEDSTMCASTV